MDEATILGTVVIGALIAVTTYRAIVRRMGLERPAYRTHPGWKLRDHTEQHQEDDPRAQKILELSNQIEYATRDINNFKKSRDPGVQREVQHLESENRKRAQQIRELTNQS
jgi:hypothetical protein